MAVAPIFPTIFRIGGCVINASSVRIGDSANYFQAFVAGSSGSRVEKVDFMNAASAGTTNTNKSVRIYIKDGSSYFLYRENRYPNISSVAATTTTFGYICSVQFDGGLILEAGQELWVGQSSYAGAQDILHCVVEAKDY